MHTLETALKQEYPSAEITVFSDDLLRDLHLASADKQAAFLQTLDAYDALIYAGGEEPYCEYVGNISDMRLPETQREALSLLGRANSPLVLVLIQGRPRLISESIGSARAVLHAGLPGFEGAEAIAKVLSGAINPSGKLPFSYPQWPNHYLPYHHKPSNIYFFDAGIANHITSGTKNTALFSFGFGLSYTRFAYRNLTLHSSGDNGQIRFTATVEVTNTGKRNGCETVLWFISQAFGRISRPVKQLRHFAKVPLQAGETATCRFEFTPQDLSYPDADGSPIAATGSFTLQTGPLQTEFRI